MDGWESRRKRTPGHDWCIVQLAAPGQIHGFDIDTNHFLGNHPPHASVEAAYLHPDQDLETAEWTEILPKSPLDPGSQHFFEIDEEATFTHVKLHIYPDGGVARLKVYGEVHKNWDLVGEEELLDLGAAINGARAVHCNDMFFSAMENLTMPGRGVNMGDGWETKRNRTPNNRDWVVIQLAHRGVLEEVWVDTCHFKGNYPDTCSLEGIDAQGISKDELLNPALEWRTLMDRQKLEADLEHHYKNELQDRQPVTHVRLSIYPDGGVSRLRLFGKKR